MATLNSKLGFINIHWRPISNGERHQYPAKLVRALHYKDGRPIWYVWDVSHDNRGDKDNL